MREYMDNTVKTPERYREARAVALACCRAAI